MTTENTSPPSKQNRFTRLDWAVLAVTLCAVGAPFGARLMANADSAAPQIAERGKVAPLVVAELLPQAPEIQAEAAFYEGLDAPAAQAPDLLDAALAVPQDPIAEFIDADDQVQAAPDLESEFLAEQMPPEPAESVAVVTPPDTADLAPEADDSETPPVAGAPDETAEPEPKTPPLVRVTMTAPPTLTPVPLASPRRAAQQDTRVASLDPASLPRLSSAERSTAIDEAPLPPIGGTEVAVAVADDAIETMTDATPEPRSSDQPVGAVATSVEPAAPAEPAALDEPAASDEPVTPAVEVAALTVPVAKLAPTKITNGPRIALVIAAAGLNSDVTRFAIEALPAGVTLAFAPVKAEARLLAQEAKDDGHTILVEIPMEPINKSRDPGPLTLRVSDPVGENLARLNESLLRIPVADGASSYLGARFNTSERAAAPVMAELAKRGLFFFENEPAARSTLSGLATRANIPYAQGLVKIDRDRSASAIRASLNALEREARQRGYAVGVGTTLRGTISTVALWAKEAEKRGVRFVPVLEVGN